METPIQKATRIINESNDSFKKLSVAFIEVSTTLQDLESSYNKLLEQLKNKEKIGK